jgi:membrane protease YdiL (CAAX protease family)
VNTTPETTYNGEPIVSAAIPATAGEPIAAPESPDNPPWGIVAALVTWLASIVMLTIVPNVCVLPYVASRYRGVEPTRELLLHDQTFMFLFVLGWLPAHFLTMALVWAIATRLGKRSLKQVMGWSWSPKFGLWQSSVLAILLFFVTLLLLGFLGGQKTDLDRILESSRAAAVTLAIIAVATAPLVEEMIYRGLLYSAFHKAIGQWGAVAIVASMFAGLHVVQYWPNAGAILSITLLSLALTLIRARTGRLLPCFVVHLVFNGIQSVIIVIEPYLRTLIEHWRHEPVNAAVTHVVRILY